MDVPNTISPCRIVPCLHRFKNLSSLTLIGGYWIRDLGNVYKSGEDWDTLEHLLWEYLAKLSFKQPSEYRLSKNLRSCKSINKPNNKQQRVRVIAKLTTS